MSLMTQMLLLGNCTRVSFVFHLSLRWFFWNDSQWVAKLQNVRGAGLIILWELCEFVLRSLTFSCSYWCTFETLLRSKTTGYEAGQTSLKRKEGLNTLQTDKEGHFLCNASDISLPQRTYSFINWFDDISLPSYSEWVCMILLLTMMTKHFFKERITVGVIFSTTLPSACVLWVM